MLPLLIFDLDGTLFQAKPACLRADWEILEEYGLPALDENVLAKHAGRGTDEFLRAVLPADTDIGAARARWIELVCKAIAESGELYPGITGVLERLSSDGHELAVCSYSPVEYIKTVLEHFSIAELIARYICAEAYSSKAEAVSSLLRQGVPAVVIGDTHGDVEAAKANGLPSIAAAYGYGNKEMLASADYTAFTPGEIISCVRKLTG